MRESGACDGGKMKHYQAAWKTALLTGEQHWKEAIESASGNACQTAELVSAPQISRTGLKPTRWAGKTVSVIMQKDGAGSHPPSSCLCRQSGRDRGWQRLWTGLWPPPACHLPPSVSMLLFDLQTTTSEFSEHLCDSLCVPVAVSKCGGNAKCLHCSGTAQPESEEALCHQACHLSSFWIFLFEGAKNANLLVWAV